MTEHHRFMLRLYLSQIDGVNQAIEALDAEIDKALAPFRPQFEHLCTLTGDVVAAALLAEIGADMSRFATAAHLVSWAGLSPGQDMSAGKRRSSRTRPGSWLKTLLVQAAWGQVRKKDSYLRAQFLRLKGRRGAKKAIVAVAASMLTAAYHMLKNDTDYYDLGPDHFRRHDREKAARQLVRRLNHLGFQVEIRSAA